MPSTAEMRRMFKESVPDDGELLNKDTEWALTVSPSERYRYKENERLAECLAPDFLWLAEHLADPDLNKTMIRDRADSLPIEKLSEPQRKAIAALRKEIEGLMDGAEELSEIEMADFLQDAPSIVKSFPSGLTAADVQVTKLGAFLVVRRDKEEWKKWEEASGKENDGNSETLGYHFHVQDPFFGPEEIREKIDRTTLVLDIQDGQLDDRIRHELFHDLYRAVLEKKTRPQYGDRTMNETFIRIKDEMIAYLLQGRGWEYEFKKIHGIFVKSQELQNANRFEILARLSSIISSRRSSRMLHARHGVYGSNLRLSDPRLQEASEEAKEKTKKFTEELVALRREILRLRFLRCPASEGIPAILMAQSFKEMVFNMSKLEQRPIDALAYVAADNPKEDADFLTKAWEIIYLGTEVKLDFIHLRPLLEELEKKAQFFQKTIVAHEDDERSKTDLSFVNELIEDLTKHLLQIDEKEVGRN